MKTMMEEKRELKSSQRSSGTVRSLPTFAVDPSLHQNQLILRRRTGILRHKFWLFSCPRSCFSELEVASSLFSIQLRDLRRVQVESVGICLFQATPTPAPITKALYSSNPNIEIVHNPISIAVSSPQSSDLFRGLFMINSTSLRVCCWPTRNLRRSLDRSGTMEPRN